MNKIPNRTPDRFLFLARDVNGKIEAEGWDQGDHFVFRLKLNNGKELIVPYTYVPGNPMIPEDVEEIIRMQFFAGVLRMTIRHDRGMA